MPLVSIIMPVYNSADFVLRAIDSVLAQTFDDWELIIIDDASTDLTFQLIKEYATAHRNIKLIKLPCNSGAAIARNTGLKKADGRYIAFLDSDDYWLPPKLNVHIDFMQKNTTPLTFSSYKVFDEKGDYKRSVGVPERVSYNDLLKTCVIGCLTVVYDTNFFGRVLMPDIKKRQDFALWLKLLQKTDFAYGIPQELACYTERNNSVSSNKLSAARYTWKVYREIEKLNILISVYYFAHYSVKGILRRYFPFLSRLIGVLN